MADINLRDLSLTGLQSSARTTESSAFVRHDGYGRLDDPSPRAAHTRVESSSQVKTKSAYTPAAGQWEKEPQIATLSEGLNLALSRLERRGSHDLLPTPSKLAERKDSTKETATESARPPPPVLSVSKRSMTSSRVTSASGSTMNLNGRKKELPGKAAARFQKLVFMVAHEMGHTLRMERIFHGSDKLESRCLIMQLVLIFTASILATATAEHAWDGALFVQDDVTLALQIATSFLTFLSLCVWYREHRIILHLTSVKIHGWFSFPNPYVSALQVLLILVHGPPGTNPIFAILTFFRCFFIFRIFKFHPAVHGIRESQLAAGSIPSFSPLFYFKTVIRVKPLLAMASILLIALTPVSIAYTFTERFADDPTLDTTFVGVAWELIYFAVTQQPPVPSVPSRTLCILASFVASALFTFIFTGMLSALELDAGHSAALKKAYERNLRKSHRDSAAAMIQSHYRAAKQRNPKTEVAASVARQRFKTLSRDLQAYLAEKEGGLNLTSLIYDVNDNCVEGIQLVKTLTGLVEQKSDDMTKLEKELHEELMTKLDSHSQSIKVATESHTQSIMEAETKALSSITGHFEATQALIMESAGQMAAAGASRPVGERPLVGNSQMEQVLTLLKAQGEALVTLRKENTELQLAHMQAMGQLISTQDQQRAAYQQSLNQHAELLSQLGTRQDTQERTLASLQTKEEEHFIAIMQALGNLTSSQAARAVSGGSLSPESLQQLLASQAPSNPQMLQKLQEEQAAQRVTLTAVAATQERVLALLEKQQAEMKGSQDKTNTLEGQVQSLLKAQTLQGEAMEKLQSTQEASQTSSLAAISALRDEVRGSSDQVYSEVQTVLAMLEAPKSTPVPAPTPTPAPPPPPPVVEQKVEEARPTVDQYAEVYIPEEQREYPQYVYETAQQVDDNKVKAIFSAFALYDLFPIIDKDRSGLLTSNEVRRITFDADIHAAYKKKERKPWPTEQMNILQAAVTKLFKGRKIEMGQKEFVTALALVPMLQ